MVAFHYPPFQGSSGLQRTLAFSRDLPAAGWAPLILSANPRAYPSVGKDLLDHVPADLPVTRAFGLDTSRHLALRGRYLPWLALPDRWVSWALGAVPAGLAMIRRHRPGIIWSTYPIATAHLIGYLLHRSTGLPWIADFRDPMIEVDPVTGARHPGDRLVWNARSWIESRAARHASRCVFVAPGALRICADRYPEVPASRWALVPNGYDEGTFREAETRPRQPRPPGSPLVLLHSGILYPTPDRDPTPFFLALSRLRTKGIVSPSTLRVVFRATAHDEHYRVLLRKHGLSDLVHLEPPIPYVDALAEMLAADGLLIFQGYTSNPAIPAKLYEYLRARRPVLALVDGQGDTARALRESGIDTIAPIVEPEAIGAALESFLERVRRGDAPVATPERIRSLSRESRARELAAVLGAVAEGR